MQDIVERDWSGAGSDGRTVRDLFDPAKLEARLVEARARRERALAARRGDRAKALGEATPASLKRAIPVHGLLFVVGLALGSIGAIVANQAIFTAVAQPPKVTSIAGTSRWLEPPMPPAVAPLFYNDVPVQSASLPTMFPSSAEPDPDVSDLVAWVAPVASKVRIARTVPVAMSPSPRLVGAQPPGAIVREATADGGLVVGSIDTRPGGDSYPIVQVARPGFDRPGATGADRPPKPTRRGSHPEPSKPPTATPPTATPKPPATPQPPAPKSPPPSVEPAKPAKVSLREPKPGLTSTAPRASGPPGQQRANSSKGPPDHAQARGLGRASGSTGKSRGSNGGRGSNGKSENGNGNGRGNGGGAGNGHGNGGGGSKGNGGGNGRK